MGLTRGSRAEAFFVQKNKSAAVREWGKRHLSMSFSGDWVKRFRSRSPGRVRSPQIPAEENGQVQGVFFELED